MKELAEKEGQLNNGGSLPSRRALRQQQVEANRAPITSFIPVVPMPTSPPDTPFGNLPKTAPANEPDTKPADAPASKPAGEGRRPAEQASSAPVTSAKAGAAAAPSAAPSASRDQDTKDQGAKVQGANVQGGRRDRRARARELAEQQAAAQEQAELAAMTPEQADAARDLLMEQAKNQIAMMDASAQKDPTAVDLKILAEQTALAERAAVLNRRAEAKQRLAEEHAASKPSRYDPTAAHNLAMVTPLEFIRVPGVDQPILRPPSTSHVPVVTSATSRLRPAAKPKQGERRPADAPETKATPVQPAPPAARTAAPSAPVRPQPPRQQPAPRPAPASTPAPPRSSTPAASAPAAPARPKQQPPARPAAPATEAMPQTSRDREVSYELQDSRSRVLARAEAVARSRKSGIARPPVVPENLHEEQTKLPPLPAGSAHGLEPLDAATAGLDRVRRNRLMQLAVLAVGAVALVAGLIMIISGLGH